MLTSKDRAKLKSLVVSEDAVCHIGKEGLSSSCIKSIEDALRAREVVKIALLLNSGETPREIASKLEEVLQIETVAIIGRKIIIYKFNKDKKTHIL